MAKFTQANRPLSVETPLGTDAVLLEKVTGVEGLSRPFRFTLQFLAEKPIAFDQIVGQPITATLKVSQQVTRYFSGVVRRLGQGQKIRSKQGEATFVRYQAEIVPAFALMKLDKQSRIFQHQTVPDILKTVLTGIQVKMQLRGNYKARDYCVQYDESDFHFASRLMEEEGIFYYFEHTADGHTMVLCDRASSCPALPQQSTVLYDASEGGTRPDLRVTDWEKLQVVRAGKCQVRDYCFQMPDSHLDAQQTIPASVTAGTVTHTLALGTSNRLNVYLGYGEFAKRYDDTDSGGGAQANDLSNLFQDNQSVAKLRMEHEAARALKVKGVSNCGQFTPGYEFTLQRHFDADGAYYLTRVDHSASIEGTYTSSAEPPQLVYENHFQCRPKAQPYRPPLRTKRPVVGPQTAVVVGPAGEEIFCDKYGRIKVQFPWDLEGQNNASSSCWLRVCQPWAGTTYGSLILPRVGQEVLVAFEQNDPDQPVVIAGLYNSKQMPPYTLPGERRKSGIVTSSGASTQAYHELQFDDTPGSENILMHSEKNMHHQAENDMMVNVGSKRKTVIGQPLGSGSGGGAGETSGQSSDEGGGGGTGLKDDPAEQVKIFGNNAEFIFGTSDEIVTGLEATIVLGGATELVLPLCAEIVIGANAEFVVGTNKEFVIGPDTIWVLGSSTETIFGAVIETIAGSYTETVTGLYTETIIGNVVETITGNVTETTTGNVTETTTGDILETITGNTIATTTGNVTETMLGDLTSTQTGNVTETTVGNKTDTTTGNVTETMTGNTTATTTGNITETVTGNKTETTTGDITSTVTGNVTETYTGNYTETKTGTITETINGEKEVTHAGEKTRNMYGARMYNTEGDQVHVHDGVMDVTNDGYESRTTLGSLDITTEGSYNIEVGGASTMEVTGDYSIEVTGAEEITVAGALEMTAADVTITAGVTTIATGGLMITP